MLSLFSEHCCAEPSNKIVLKDKINKNPKGLKTEHELNSSKPLIISVMKSNPPFTIQLENGELTGLYVDFWRLWSKFNHQPIQFRASDFLENLDDLKSSRVDFHSGLFKSSERGRWADFSIPIHHVNTAVYFYDKHLKPKKLSELSGKTFAVPEGSFQSKYVVEHYPLLNFVTFVDNQQVISLLLKGEIDGIVAEEPFVDSLLSNLGIKGILTKSDEIILSNQVFALVPKGHLDLVNQINRGIKNIPIDVIVALEKQWLPNFKSYFSKHINSKVPSLTLTEIEIIEQTEPLSVGSDPDWEPIEFVDSFGNSSGISFEYLNILKDSHNLKIKPVERFKWESILQKAANGEIDLISAITKTKKRQGYLSFTQPYVTFPVVVIVRVQSKFLNSLNDLKDVSVGIVPDGSLEETLLEEYPLLNYKKLDNVALGISTLKNGGVDAFVGNYFLIKHYLKDEDYENIRVSAFTPYTIDISMAVSKGNEHLLPIINKSIEQVSSNERLSILNKWRRVEFKVDDDLIIFLYWAIPIASLALILFFYVSIINRKMLLEIKDRNKSEEHLKRERLIADNANRAKDEFLANMSHELRTPMNSVVGMSRLLKSTSMSNEQSDFVETINRSSIHLLSLINDILDLSKIEAGKLSIENIPVNIRKIIRSLMEQEFKSTHLIIETDISESVPNVVLGDRLRLNQILKNIISNAIKFTKKGSIKLIVSVMEEKTNSTNKPNYQIQFKIKDDGIGMSEAQVKNVFQSFNQVDSSNSRQFGGAGLGLKLCKQLCLLMGGDISVESKLGEGSQVIFHLNFGKLQRQDRNSNIGTITEKNKFGRFVSEINEGFDINQAKKDFEKNKRRLKNKQVLVVDDNPINLIVAKKTLELHGLKVTSTDNGQYSLELIAKHKFDYVLMDIQMPIMNGYQTVRKIRESDANQHLAIIALTASIGNDEVEKIKNSGMNGYAIKPINIITLFSLLVELTNAKKK